MRLSIFARTAGLAGLFVLSLLNLSQGSVHAAVALNFSNCVSPCSTTSAGSNLGASYSPAVDTNLTVTARQGFDPATTDPFASTPPGSQAFISWTSQNNLSPLCNKTGAACTGLGVLGTASTTNNPEIENKEGLIFTWGSAKTVDVDSIILKISAAANTVQLHIYVDMKPQGSPSNFHFSSTNVGGTLTIASGSNTIDFSTLSGLSGNIARLAVFDGNNQFIVSEFQYTAVDVAAIPEPGSIVLAFSGLAVMCYWRRRRMQAGRSPRFSGARRTG